MLKYCLVKHKVNCYMNILKDSKLSTSNSLTTMLQQGDNYLATNIPLMQPSTQH